MNLLTTRGNFSQELRKAFVVEVSEIAVFDDSSLTRFRELFGQFNSISRINSRYAIELLEIRNRYFSEFKLGLYLLGRLLRDLI
jgi:hypothetical protein